MKRCKHQGKRYLRCWVPVERGLLPKATWGETDICYDCGEWLSLGPSSDEPEAVQIEIRAAGKVSGLIDPHAECLAFAHGWNDHISKYAGEERLWQTDEYQVGYLARVIACHDENAE